MKTVNEYRDIIVKLMQATPKKTFTAAELQVLL